MNALVEIARLAIAFFGTALAGVLPFMMLAICSTIAIYRDDNPLRVAALAAILSGPAIYAGMWYAQKLGMWFVINWGRPYLPAPAPKQVADESSN